MQKSSLVKAGILTIIISVLFIGAWEIYLRTHGVNVAYDDGESLWSHKRSMVYEPSDKATVFIGSSRNKFDLDINTWRALTGEDAIQLAIEGTSPMPFFNDLANDKNFKGKLVVDVTEILFFSSSPGDLSLPVSAIEYYKKLTPAQRFSLKVDRVLESKLVFLDKNNYSINAMLDKLRIPNRPEVFTPRLFPMDFNRVTFDRQCIMTKRFESDTNLQNDVKSIWYFYGQLPNDPPASGPKLDSIMNLVKSNVDKIQSRGGKVIFVRTPSTGPFLQGEKKGYPRPDYWDRILAVTHCPGIHFEDYPSTAHLQCLEFSHLKQSDAIIWTTNIIDIMQKEKGWVFPHKPAGN